MPPDEDRLGVRSPFLHPDSQPRFLALLDERQTGVFGQAPERFYLSDGEKREEDPAEPPAMGLDSRDKKLTALKRVVGLLVGTVKG
jgi:hypothetical protein